MIPKILLSILWLIIYIKSYSQDSASFSASGRFESWTSYGGDAGGNRYSSLKEINDSNVHSLKTAWTFRTNELEKYKGTDALKKAAFETTPILTDNTLYFSTPSSRVFAIDPVSGKQKWLYDPEVDLKKHYSEITSRGVSAWPSANDSIKNKKHLRRIFLGTIDGRLIALDAANGKPISSFGKNGQVDLRSGIGDDISMTSPPAIAGNLVIVGSSLGDNYKSDYPRGTVRAFNALTGKQQWMWDPIAFKSSNRSGAANAWSVISVDEERQLVFIPTSCASPDYFGGGRKGSNLYANSIVALHAATGKMAWHFQVVHHDLWDYDIAAQPVLIEIKRDNRMIPAVAVGTKMGHIFILDRETGKPIFPIEERAVPVSEIPEETAHPTQPFPVLPKPLGLQEVSIKNAWGVTPGQKKIAEERISGLEGKGIFTPPGTRSTIITPGNAGGIHWGGMCFDPVKGILYTNINWLAAVITLIPREKVSEHEQIDKTLIRAETGLQLGTPYVMKRDYLFTFENGEVLMQTAPPWGTLNAIDINTGSDKWEVPLGYMLDTVKYPESKKWGSLNFGGSIVTAGNLVFVAASRDDHFRAFNSITGKVLWENKLPASGQATPMTYSVNGKQYVVIAAGGHGKFSTTQGDFVIAFATPLPIP